jgi:ankyrin repeat protein
VVYICGCIPARIRHALDDLPETLDETYRRTLREINKADWEFAHRLFQFVAVASRPLRVQELAELLAFDFNTRPIPKFHEGWRLGDPVDAVLSTCSSFLAIVDGGSRFGKVIQFSHFSVKEFLTSTRLADANDTIPRRHHVSMMPAHTLAAQACLGILLHLDKDEVTRDSLAKWPLVEYAAEHWGDHAQFGDVSRSVKDGIKQLFDPNKPHFAVYVWIHDPTREQNGRAERPLPPIATPLHYAALWDLHFIIELLVTECSQNVLSRGFTDNDTPLHLASKHGHMKTIRVLMEHGADVAAQNGDGATPLFRASCCRQMEAARMLLDSGAEVTARNKTGHTPLHPVSHGGNVEFARMLIERGADVTAQNMYGKAPLHSAGHLEVARMLIERGADMEVRCVLGWTPLHYASSSGEVKIVRMLIERGADVRAKAKDGRSPLHSACYSGEGKIAHMLIERGVDVVAQTRSGQSPLHMALRPYRHGQMEGLVRTLIEHGADVTAPNKDGDTPLHLAVTRGEIEVARMLIERGADVTAQNRNGEAPLHLAATRGRVKFARMLIECGADVTAQTKDGQTPLHQAWSPDVVLMLVEHGADVTAECEDGKTPLHLAPYEGLVEATHMLTAGSINEGPCLPLFMFADIQDLTAGFIVKSI